MQKPDGGLMRNTGSLLLGHAVRVPVLALYFVVATRALGVDAYGVLVAVGAVVAIVAPFSALGGGSLIVKYGAIDAARTRHWLGAGLLMSLLGTTLLGGALLAISMWVLPEGTPAVVLLCVLLSEFVLARAVDLSASVFVAREQMHLTALCQVVFACGRLASALLLLVLPWRVSLLSWVVALLAGSATAALVCLVLASRAVGAPRLSLTPYRGHLVEGLLFSVGVGVQTAHNDVDKAMLGRMAGGSASGTYGAAYRIVDMAWMPMRALLAAAQPRMFRHGAQGMGELAPFVVRLAGPALGYSLLVTVVMVTAAPLLEPLLGEEYADAVPLLRALAVLVLLRCLYYLPADMLTGIGRQGVRTTLQLSVLGLNVLLNLALIPLYGVWGAVWATLVSEVILGATLWTALLAATRADRRTRSEVRA